MTPSSSPNKRQKLNDTMEATSSPLDPEYNRLLEENRLLKDENARLKEHIQRLEEGAAVVSPCQGLLQDIIAFPSKAVVISPDSLPPDLKNVWNGLMSEAKKVSEYQEAFGYQQKKKRRLTKQVFHNVKEALENHHPILTHVASQHPDKDDYKCLLSSCCALIVCTSNLLWLHGDEKKDILATIERLIQLNPYALVWNPSTMETIARGFGWEKFDLFLTIASKFSWVFTELPEVSKSEIISSFLSSRLDDVYHVWEWDLVTEFFKNQPKMLEIEFEERTIPEQFPSPLHYAIKILRSSSLESDCTAPSDALINLMVQEFPAALLKQDYEGNTPLHTAFINLNGALLIEDPVTNNIYYRICVSAGKILLQRNPSALLVQNNFGLTPLECVGNQAYTDEYFYGALRPRRYAQEPVRAFVVEAFREYYPRTLTPQMKEIPFLQQAYDLLEQEAAFARNYVRIKRASAIIAILAKVENERGSDASDDSKDIIYSNWANGQLDALSIKIETIRETDIPVMGKRFDGSESESEGSESDDNEEI